MEAPLQVLIIEDNRDDAELALEALRRAGFDLHWTLVDSEPEFLAELNKGPDIILSDYSMPRFSGLRAAELLRSSGLDIPLILISGTVGEDVAVAAMKHGATDYLIKDRMVRLGSAVERALQERRLRKERKRAELHMAAFSSLGQKLSAAKLAPEAAEIILEIADQLFAWDACSLDLYSPDTNLIHHVFNLDTIDGKRKVFPPAYDQTEPSPQARRVIEQGAQLILRDQPSAQTDTYPFGDLSRLSASLMFVPIHDGAKVIGILSIQSYTHHAYTEDDLNKLQALADHCGGALNRIQASESLRQSEERFRQLAENINEVFWITDPARTQMIYVSPAYEKIWGRTCESLRAEPLSWRDAIHSNDLERVLQRAKDHLTDGTFDEKYRILRPDRSVRWIRDRAFPVRDSTGAVERLVGVAEDITNHQQLEDQLRQSQKMEAIGQLAGGVAHDFNNILAVIQMQADLVKASGTLSPDQVEHTDEIRNAVQRAVTLTRQLLLFSRREAMQPRDMDLNESITQMTKMLPRILGEDIRTRFKFAGPSLPIHADPGMMDQVLMNLAVNSRDAMPNGGELIIETTAVEFNGLDVLPSPKGRVGTFACLSVSDNGCGIPAANLPQIFEPFFTTKDVGKGTGLGLATVFGIVQQHHGWIDVYSEVGQGTTFRIYFPKLERDSTPKAVPIPAESYSSGTETILVVEDDPALRASVCLALSRLRYRVLEANNGPAALKVWNEHKKDISLLLTDLVMPEGINGKELARQFQKERPDLKVVFTSGYSAEIAGKDLSLKNGSNFLPKPYEARKLSQIIRANLDRQKPQPLPNA